MKKIFALTLAALLLLGLCACGGAEAAGATADMAPAEEVEEWARTPTVQIDGEHYILFGTLGAPDESSVEADGEITSCCGAYEYPTQDDQANFGTGCPYRFGSTAGTVEVFRNGVWELYATKDVLHELRDKELEEIWGEPQDTP